MENMDSVYEVMLSRNPYGAILHTSLGVSPHWTQLDFLLSKHAQDDGTAN